MSLSAKLVVVGGDVKTTEIKLRLPSTIGRGRGTTIMLPHPLVSRQHCELYEDAGRLMVRDLGSLNGTFVNNERITESPLGPGELLTIGTVTFRAVYETQSQTTPAAGAAPPSKSEKIKRQDATVRAAPKQAPPPKDDDELEFNFDQPLMSEEPHTAAAAKNPDKHPTDRLPPLPEKQAAASAAKNAQPGQPAAKPPASKQADEATVDFSKRAPAEEEDEVESPAASDDDLNDFLKSLGNK